MALPAGSELRLRTGYTTEPVVVASEADRRVTMLGIALGALEAVNATAEEAGPASGPAPGTGVGQLDELEFRAMLLGPAGERLDVGLEWALAQSEKMSAAVTARMSARPTT